MRLEKLGVEPPPPGPADWNDDGVVIIPRFFHTTELRAYRAEWSRAHELTSMKYRLGVPVIEAARPGGWNETCPYMWNDALRELCCSGKLGNVLYALTGDQMGVHLNLTGWVSTERDWHADGYLNEPEVGDSYAAIWVALQAIHPDSGVFQYVPGSHRWPQITREIIGRYYDLTDPQWPKHSEGILTELFESEIEARGAKVMSHVPEEGDLLVWHNRLLHRGSKPKLRDGVPRIARPALIAHYSGIHHRAAMPPAVQHPAGGWYFPIETKQPVRA